MRQTFIVFVLNNFPEELPWQRWLPQTGEIVVAFPTPSSKTRNGDEFVLLWK
jgi:hypothetical protein